LSSATLSLCGADLEQSVKVPTADAHEADGRTHRELLLLLLGDDGLAVLVLLLALLVRVDDLALLRLTIASDAVLRAVERGCMIS
jgi:hypothetical protein